MDREWPPVLNGSVQYIAQAGVAAHIPYTLFSR